MENEIQNQVSLILGEYGWLFIVGVLTLLFRSTIEKFVAGLKIFMGNDYNEDDVVEVDGKPGRIVRCGVWSTTFFTNWISHSSFNEFVNIFFNNHSKILLCFFLI